MTAADVSFMHSELNVMSNERLGATVIDRKNEIFYDCGVRLKGSQRGRLGGSRVSFSVAFPAEQPYRGLHSSISLDRSGGWGIGAGPHGQDEIIFKHLVTSSGDLPGMYDDINWLVAPRPSETGPALVMMARYNSDFLDESFEDGSDGQLYKMELIYHATTATADGFKRPQPDGVIGTDIRNLGTDKETYRYNFMIDNHRTRDDYGPMIELAEIMSLSGTSLDARIESILDVDESMRMYAAHALVGANDTYMLGSNAHNSVLYQRPEDGKFLFLHWDQDFAWSRSTTDRFFGGENLAKVLRRPQYERLFWGHIHDMINSVYTTDYMRHWTGHYGDLADEPASFARVLNYVGARRSVAERSLPAAVPFEITTNSGNNVSVDGPEVEIEGTGWIDVRRIWIVDLEPPAEIDFVDGTEWRGLIPLVSGANELLFVAEDHRGNVVETDRITVTTTFEFLPPNVTSVDPAAAVPGEVVTVRGTDFRVGANVLFGGTPGLNVERVDASTLRVEVPVRSVGTTDLVVQQGDQMSNAVAFEVLREAARFVRGDTNGDRSVNISDALATLLHLFSGKVIDCPDAADTNDDETLNISDGVFVLNYLFAAGAEPPAPFPAAGVDPTGDGTLGCGFE